MTEGHFTLLSRTNRLCLLNYSLYTTKEMDIGTTFKWVDHVCEECTVQGHMYCTVQGHMYSAIRSHMIHVLIL